MRRVNIGKVGTREGTAGSGRPAVVVSPNPKRESVFIDQFGNEIDPRTKQIIKKNTDQDK